MIFVRNMSKRIHVLVSSRTNLATLRVGSERITTIMEENE